MRESAGGRRGAPEGGLRGRCEEGKIISGVSRHKGKSYQQGGTRSERSGVDLLAERARTQQQRGFKAPLLNLAGELRVGEMKLFGQENGSGC